MDIFLQDLRYGFRLLYKRPGFSTVVVIILAIGIGISSALYSIIDGAWLNPDPYENKGQWVAVRGNFPRKNLTSWFFSIPEFYQMSKSDAIFSDVAALRHINMNLSDRDTPERVFGAGVTAEAFSMTGVRPYLGRVFTAEEDRPGGENVAVMSYRLWQRRYQGQQDILGQAIKINDQIYTVIGVMPNRYLLWGADMWVPLRLNPSDADRSARSYWVAGILKPDISVGRASAMMQDFAQQMEQDNLGTTPEYQGLRLWVEDVSEAVLGPLKGTLIVLLGAVFFVLAISCANVGNLLLVRATSRRKEVAVRMAMGASRSRIVSQLLVESLILSLLGGLIGYFIARWSVPLLVSLIPPAFIAAEAEIKVSLSVFLVSVAVSLCMWLLFSLIPALQSSKLKIAETLKEAGRKGSGDNQSRKARSVLVVAEMALALIILVGTGLMIRSYMMLTNVELGFDPSDVLSMRISLPETKYREGQRAINFFEELDRRVKALPGVQDSAFVSTRPMSERADSQDFSVEGRPLSDAGGLSSAVYRTVSPDYFNVMKIQLVKGRYITDQDQADSLRVAVISETMAKQYWPDADPIGQRVKFGNQDTERVVQGNVNPEDQSATIVGVVKDVRQARALDGRIRPEFYVPQRQRGLHSLDMALLVQTTGNASSLTEAIRRQVQALDPQQPVYDVLPYDEIVGLAFGPKRLALVLLSLFAAIALVLATVGLYAIVSYFVSERTNEIGIRMALGAQPKDVLKQVLMEGIKLALLGIVVGLIGAYILTRVMASLLYGVSTTDVFTFAVVPMILIVVTLIACYFPARRATKVDPVIALRFE